MDGELVSFACQMMAVQMLGVVLCAVPLAVVTFLIIIARQRKGG